MSPSASVTMLTPSERETFEEAGRVFLVAAEAVQRFGEDDVELGDSGRAHQRLEPCTKQRCSGDRVVVRIRRRSAHP